MTHPRTHWTRALAAVILTAMVALPTWGGESSGGIPPAPSKRSPQATSTSKPVAEPPLPPDEKWFEHARVAGLSVSGLRITDAQMIAWIDDLRHQGATVIEADSRLSDYLTDAEFASQVELAGRFSKLAHDRGMRVVWYIPSLEVITADGVVTKHSMARDHLDWLQLSFDRKTRGYFYGQKVFWVEPRDESAWMCPNGPYREYFIERLKKLAGTGVDALWLDVPIMNLVVGRWACTDKYCQAKFVRDTGMRFPARIDLHDAAFVRFVTWRHEMLAEFLRDCAAAMKSVSPGIRCVAEIVTLDHLGATDWGADGTFLKDVDVVWEVDSISDTTGMADARPDDWYAQMTAYKWCKGALEGLPSWSFSYGWRSDDAQLVMASCLAAQINPYESRVPKMTTTVGRAFRRKMFDWVRANQSSLFDAQSAAPVAIVYSSASRDLVDGTRSNAWFASWNRPRRDLLWYASSPEESVESSDYLAEYRGWAKLFIQNGVPFDIVPANRLNAERLAAYKVVVAPQMAALDEAQAALLQGVAERGGTLVVSGPLTGWLTPEGKKRPSPLWGELMAPAARAANRQSVVTRGSGRVACWAGTPGKRYLLKADPAVAAVAKDWMASAGVQGLLAEPAPVYLQVYRASDGTVVHAVHYGWHKNRDSTAAPRTVSLRVPVGHAVTRVLQTSPGDGPPREVPFTRDGDAVRFTASVGINSLFLLQER